MQDLRIYKFFMGQLHEQLPHSILNIEVISIDSLTVLFCNSF